MIDSFSGRWSFLSNFYPCKIEFQGITYPSNEHYYVAMKVGGDQMIDGQFCTMNDCREMISKISTSGKVKRFGRTKIKVRKDWDDIKLKVMEYGLREKFKHENLREMLLQTGDEKLVEGNWWHDVYFGSCSCPKCGNNGQNHLGKLLMKIRDEIKSKSGLGSVLQ